MAGSRLRTWLLGLVAVLALLFLGYRNPVAYLLMGTWLPLPLLVVGWRLGAGAAGLLAVAGGAAAFALQPGLTVFLENLGLWVLLLTGVLLSAMRQRGWPAGNAVCATVTLLGLMGLFFFLGQAFVQGINPGALWGVKTRELSQAVETLLQDAGWSTPGVQVMGLPREDWLKHLTLALPALMVINLALVAWLNSLVVRQIAGALGWADAEPSLSLWASPEWLIFPFLSAGFAMLVPVAGISLIAFNLFLILGFAYFGQGVAVMAATLQRFRAPWILRSLGYFLVFMNPFLMLMVTLLGLLDLWFDFRRLGTPREV